MLVYAAQKLEELHMIEVCENEQSYSICEDFSGVEE